MKLLKDKFFNLLKQILNKIKLAFRNYIFIFKTVFKANKFVLITAILSTIVIGVTPATTSVILKKIIAAIEVQVNSVDKTYYFLVLYLIIYIGVFIVQDVVLDFRFIVYRISGLSLAFDIQSKIIKKLKTIEYYMFYDTKFQDLYSLVLRNSEHSPLEIMYSLMAILSILIRLISAIFFIMCFNIKILLLLVMCFIPSIISRFRIQKENVNVWEKQMNNNRQSGYYFSLMTTKESIKEIRQYNLYNYFEKKREERYLENLSVWDKFGKKEFKYTSISHCISKFGIFISIFWLIINTVNNKYSISDFVFYSNLIFSLQNIYIELIANISSHYTSMLFINEFFKFLDIKNIINCGNKIPKKHNNYYVLEFRDVCFKYPNTDRYILKNINYSFKTGERICIVGHNGCGKTTLINLILRVYDPTSGSILLNGIDIRDYNIYEYRKILSFINQDYIRYSVSVKDCISFGDIENIDNIDITKLKMASQRATSHEFINKLSNQYDSNLLKIFSNSGEELSGGQWQKISLARVFFSNADILIFDEPTSAIDPLSEFKIYQEIEKPEKNKIKIFISHRMYSLKNATNIIMMSDGKILDTGTHNDLISRNKTYQKIFKTQAVRYEY